MSKKTINLQVHLDPSDVFEKISLPNEFESKYQLQPLLIFNSDRERGLNYFLLKKLESKNIYFRKPFLYHTSNARVCGHSNLVSNSNLKTSILGLIFNLNKHKLFANEQDSYEVLKNGNLLISYNEIIKFKEGFYIGGSDNFGHWLFNSVAKLCFLEIIKKNIPIIVPSYMPQRFYDCLKYFVKKNLIIKIPKNSLCMFESLYLATSPWYKDEQGKTWWSNNTVNFLNENFIKNQKKMVRDKNKRRIYISRKKCRWRKILNEEVIIKQLKSLNFETIYPEELSIEEQITLAMESEIIISPFGASLCLFIFASNKTKCIELRPDALSRMDLGELYCGPLNLPFAGIIGKNEKKGLNVDFIIREDIDWESLFNKMQ